MPINNEKHTKLVHEALVALAKAGYSAWLNNTGGTKTQSRGWVTFGKKGSGDILLVLQPFGTHTELEAKTGNAVQRQSQKIHQKYVVEKNGGIYIVFHSVEELLSLIKKAEKWDQSRRHCIRP